MSKDKLSNVAYDKLRNDIMSLKLKPGSILYELQLSKDLDISRTPIRTALQKLVSEGLVELKTGKKNYYYVSNLTISTFRDIYQLRSVLELLSIELTTVNRTQEIINVLSSLLDKHEELIDNNEDIRVILDVDRRFHNMIAGYTNNLILFDQLGKIIDQYYRYNIFALTSSNRSRQAMDEHRDLLNSIKNGDVNDAKRLMSLHLNKSNENILFELANMKE